MLHVLFFFLDRDICKKFGLDTPRSTTLGSASRSPLASSILNLTGNENLSTCPENSILDTSVLNFTDHKGLGLEVGLLLIF